MSSKTCQDMWINTVKPGIEKRGLFNVSQLNKIMQNLSYASNDEITTLFLMFSFEIWAQQYLD
jgi:hypothetical protein